MKNTTIAFFIFFCPIFIFAQKTEKKLKINDIIVVYQYVYADSIEQLNKGFVDTMYLYFKKNNIGVKFFKIESELDLDKGMDEAFESCSKSKFFPDAIVMFYIDYVGKSISVEKIIYQCNQLILVKEDIELLNKKQKYKIKRPTYLDGQKIGIDILKDLESVF